MKCAGLCIILIGVWNGIPLVIGESFEYECDLLQRMDSLESKIVLLENKAKASDKVIADLESKDKDKDQLIAILEGKVNASDKVVTYLESKVNEQAQLIIGLTNKVVTLEESVSNPGVIFHAKNITVQPTARSVIKFSTIVENTDDLYSLTTGCFTAIRNGIYWFSAHVCTHTEKCFSPSIYVGETLIVRAFTWDKDDGACSTVSAVTSLQVNDLVCLKAGPLSSIDAVWTGSEYFKTDHFMGALVHG